MTFWDLLTMFLGLSLFLYGMNVMGDALKKSAGSRLADILAKMTSNPAKGFLLGFAVTAIIQSSSATTVMVVGFVNSGTMTLLQAIGVIMGANVGTTVTAWLTGLSGLSTGASTLTSALVWLKPSSWIPLLAVAGIIMTMLVRRGRKRDIGTILLGFAVLMTGMDIMSGAVSGLADNEAFKSILTMFENPVLGVLAGAALTAILQSSSASVGILQSLATTGAISYGMAIPIIMGQNIGTCITAVLSAIGANKNGKRAAYVQLYFNVIATVILLSAFAIVNAIANLAFVDTAINMWGIAAVHTLFNLIAVLIIGPFYKQLACLATVTVRDSKNETEIVSLLDERLFAAPAFALEQATKATYTMAEVSRSALKKSLELLGSYNAKLADGVRELEEKADRYEDALGSYLVKLSSCDMTEKDSGQVTKLLHIIGDLERISDHAVNIVESAEEMKDKKLSFSAEATREIGIMQAALSEILDLTYKAITENDVLVAANVEPLEEVIDILRDTIKLNHVLRLQKSECTIEHGFVLSDILTNLERVSDHCSNLASCVVEISEEDALNMHKYTDELKSNSDSFKEKLVEYKKKYSI